MKKLYSFFFLLFLCFFFHRSSAQILSFSFAGSDGDESTWPSASQAAGIVPSAISRGPGIMAAANADRFNSKNWTTAPTPDFNDYIEFTIAPTAGYSASLSTIAIQHQRSSTGPTSFVIRTSLDGFSTNATNVVTVPDVNTNQSSTFTFSGAITITAPLTLRVYGYNAESANGTWGPGESTDGNDIVLSGSYMILPVKFINVSAAWKGRDVEVKWTSATESELLYYIVERSDNGRLFSELTKVYPQNNNGGLSEYRSLDLQPLSKTSFYRVKAVEANGHVSYTNIVRIETGSVATSMGLYPNPVKAGSQITVQLNGITEGNYEMRIYNSAAQLVYCERLTVRGINSVQTVSLPVGQKGVYIAEITGRQTMQQRFVIQ